MLLSFIFILLIAFGGLALTYLFAEEESFLWRIAAGNITGAAIFGLSGFTLANFFGLSAATVFIALLVTMLPLILLIRKDYQKRFRRDWARAKGKFQGANAKKTLRFIYYAFFFLLFWLFFERVMFETEQGIFTGGSQNLGDLPFHLGAIFSFTEGQNFPPQSPSFAGAKFSYPFIADFLTACFMKFGADVKAAMHLQNVAWAFSLLVILENFVFKLTKNHLAGKIAPALLFFSGGIGFLWFFNNFFEQSKGFFDFLYNLPRDYTIYEPPGASGERFRWGNALVTLFITQRSLLLGMPLTLVVLQKIWTIFSSSKIEIKMDEQDLQGKKSFSAVRFPFSIFLVGLLAGTLPLIHLHSLAVLFVVAVFVLILKPEKWREWIAFGAGVGIIAVPALIWAMSGSASRTSEFVAFHFGWDAKDENILWFWVKNTGIFIPVLLFGLYLIFSPPGRGDDTEKAKKRSKIEDQKPETKDLLLFYFPFVFLFIISNMIKLAPWQWDNIKVLIYWFIGSLPFAAFALAWLFKQDKFFKTAAVLCLFVLTLSGALDVWRVVSNQINYKVFEPDAVKIAELIKTKTAPDALFLNAPTYNTAIVLSGRRSLMRFPGHLSSHGIDYAEREADVKRIYEGTATADIFLRKYDVDYILVSPEEKNLLTVNEQFFQKYPVIAESGQYKVYKVK